jgi:regulation of enolase protein 1 (concanavalin A-like superfamily)
MIRSRNAVFFLAAVCLLVGAVAAADKKVQKIKGWGAVVDPDGDCKVAEDNGKVTITIPGSHHNLNPTPDFNNLSAPRVLQDVTGDFVLQVKVPAFTRPEANTSSNGRNSYVGAGLVVWYDGNYFIRFLRAANGDSNSLFASVELYEAGELLGWKNQGLDDQSAYLKLQRHDGRFTFSVSGDGQDWTDLPTVDLKLPKKLKAGIVAVNSTTKEFAPQFEDLKLTNE